MDFLFLFLFEEESVWYQFVEKNSKFLKIIGKLQF